MANRHSSHEVCKTNGILIIWAKTAPIFRRNIIKKGGIKIQRNEEIQLLHDKLYKLKKLYKSLPEGSLSIGHSKCSVKWFYTINNRQRYLKKNEIALAKKLAIKRYVKYKIDYLEASIKEYSLTGRKKHEAQSKLGLLLSDSAYTTLLSDFFAKTNIEASSWMTSPYPKSQSHPENLTHATVRGLLVRSKSESMIAMALAEQGIPFRYENIITINDIEYAPDFTILHPVTGKLYYWEHFGMIDNDSYYNDFTQKIKNYTLGNIILGDNLIATFETANTPLSYESIQNIIKQYFTY